jgi:TRAP-type mannitol/chloroaromatic compound transport system substrate-binding protein
MGFYKVAPYYYSGWHEPGSILELTFNKHVWNKLAFEQQAMIEVAATELNANMSCEFHAANIHALKELEALDVKILQFPKDILNAGKVALQEVLTQESQKNGDFLRVYNSIKSHLELSKKWSDVSLGYFLNQR